MSDPLCKDCDCPKSRCDSYGYGRKCCPDCNHWPCPDAFDAYPESEL